MVEITIDGRPVQVSEEAYSFSVRWRGDHFRVNVAFGVGGRAARFSGEAETLGEAVALGVNAMVAYSKGGCP